MYASERKWGPVTLALAIAAGLVIGGIVLSAALTLLGFLAGIVFWFLRLALLVGLAAAVVWGVRYVLTDRHNADRY